MKFFGIITITLLFLHAPLTSKGQSDLDPELIEAYRKQRGATGSIWNKGRTKLPDGTRAPYSKQIKLSSDRWNCIEEENRILDAYPHKASNPQFFNTTPSDDKWLPRIERVQYKAPKKFGQYRTMAPYKNPVKVPSPY